ncbi:MAG: hypothetical protein KDJ75_00860 [Alphaproteobacteria bacterium]|nr:hypothetical protein [Alphaproteobacteria bacterium]
MVYDWVLENSEAEQYEDFPLYQYFPRTMGKGHPDAGRMVRLGTIYDTHSRGVDHKTAQGHLTQMFGDNALLVAIDGSKPDMLNGWRCEDVRFYWVDKTDTPDIKVESPYRFPSAARTAEP